MVRTIVFILFIFSLLFGLSFAYWFENINVYVVGMNNIGLSNATVTVVFQATQCNYHEQIEKQTNQQGLASFQFMNTIDETFTPNCVEHFFTIDAAFAGSSNSTVGYVNDTDNNYLIALPVLQYELIVRDGSNHTITGATATFEGTTFSANADGTITIDIPSGTISNVIVNYGGIARTISVNPSYSNSTIVKLPMYDLNVELFDDQGNRIDGTVTYNNVQKISTIESPAIFPKFTEKSAQFIVNTSGTQRIVNANITSGSLDMHIDLTPPAIRDVKTEVTGRNDLMVTAAIVDSGVYASGLNSNPMLGYSLGTTGGYTEIKMYPASFNTFEATIPSNDANITYTITAIDNQNNSNKYTGNYSFSSIATEIKPTTQIEIIPLIGIFIFVIVVIIIYQRIRGQSSI